MLYHMMGTEARGSDKFKFDLLCFFVTMGHMTPELALRIYRGEDGGGGGGGDGDRRGAVGVEMVKEVEMEM